MRRITKTELPKILYKYRDWSNYFHKRIISKQEIYFPKPSEFNDPFDGNIPIRGELITYEECLEKNLEILNIVHHDKDQKLVYEYAKEITDGKTLWHPDTIKRESKEQIEKWDRIIGLFSLSELNNNILMWSHYSNYHTGFVVGFDTSILDTHSEFDCIEPLIYQVDYPIIHPAKDDLDVKFHKKFFYKSTLWSYEHEWRISKNHIKNRIIKLTTDSIIEIILGCRMSQKDKNDILKKIDKHLSKNIKIYQAVKKDCNFGLDIMQIK
jgi:hypothetical protein